ncbi:MAG TPA: hypothetical protein VM055_03665 [Novosphingobium sp.]|nr:hypothetical protein [Novosphingobium sp.]
MSLRVPLSSLLALALAACEQTQPPAAPPSPVATEPQAAVPTRPSIVAKPVLALPDRFAALGTEPFWAADVAGATLTYKTPEDQAGQLATVTRTAGEDFVELRGTLAGQALTLTVSKGPCSDGMSDTVYPFSVTRRLGDDTQRGCARPG